MHLFHARRVRECKRACVQRDAPVGERVPGAVLQVTDQRQSDAPDGDAQLMRTAGQGLELEQGPTAPALQYAPARTGELGPGPGSGAGAHGIDRAILQQPLLDLPPAPGTSPSTMPQ